MGHKDPPKALLDRSQQHLVGLVQLACLRHVVRMKVLLQSDIEIDLVAPFHARVPFCRAAPGSSARDPSFEARLQPHALVQHLVSTRVGDELVVLVAVEKEER